MLWFGSAHKGNSYSKEEWVKTPVGIPCIECLTTIEEEDDGFLFPYTGALVASTVNGMVVFHRLCFLSKVFGLSEPTPAQIAEKKAKRYRTTLQSLTLACIIVLFGTSARSMWLLFHGHPTPWLRVQWPFVGLTWVLVVLMIRDTLKLRKRTKQLQAWMEQSKSKADPSRSQGDTYAPQSLNSSEAAGSQGSPASSYPPSASGSADRKSRRSCR